MSTEMHGHYSMFWSIEIDRWSERARERERSRKRVWTRKTLNTEA